VFIDPLHGVLLFTAPDGTQSAVATSDGGESWGATKAPRVTVQADRLERGVLLRHGHRLLFWLLAVTAVGGPSIEYLPFVSVSDDGGQTWSQPRPAPSIVQPWYIGPYPRLDDRGRLLLLDDRRLWISEDDGDTWAALLMQVPAELRLTMLISAVPGALYAMAEKGGPVRIVRPVSAGAVPIAGSPPTLTRSPDGGAHWSLVALPRPPQP